MPENGDVGKYSRVYQWYLKNNSNSGSIVLLNSLLKNQEDVSACGEYTFFYYSKLKIYNFLFKSKINLLNERIKLSNDEKQLLSVVQILETKISKETSDIGVLLALKHSLADTKFVLKKSAKIEECIEFLKYLNRPDLIEQVKDIQIPKLRLNQAIIISHEIFDEKSNRSIQIGEYISLNKLKIKFGPLLYDLRMIWINSNFTLTQEDLLKKIDKSFLENYSSEIKKNKKI